MQEIPQSKIVHNGKVGFNWADGLWERKIKIKTKGEILSYTYSMNYNSKSLMLSIYHHRNELSHSDHLEYPSLPETK
jgi:hypothetical protein